MHTTTSIAAVLILGYIVTAISPAEGTSTNPMETMLAPDTLTIILPGVDGGTATLPADNNAVIPGRLRNPGIMYWEGHLIPAASIDGILKRRAYHSGLKQP